MSYKSVKFIEKEYNIPEDILTYMDLLKFTDDIRKQLTSAFLRKLRYEIQKGNIGLLDDEDFCAELERQVGRFIAKLCDNGIFTRTVSDYLRDNKGYRMYSDVNQAALEKMSSLLSQEMDSWQAGFEDAVQRRDAHVTGMGFSILSNSFINHAIYAAMQASTINRQEKEAVMQYKKDMDDLRLRLDSRYGEEKSNYISNTYIPNMEDAFTVLAYEMMDKYVEDLITNDKFDRETLNYLDAIRSDDLLKNLMLSHNKKAVLENAFIACPYNIDVYMQAMKYDLLDYESFQTAKLFGFGEAIISFLQENLGDFSNSGKRELNFKNVELLSLYTGRSLRDITSYVADFIVDEYSKTTSIFTDNTICHNIMNKEDEKDILAGDDISKKKAEMLFNPVVTDALWNKLTLDYGHDDLLDRLLNLLPDKTGIHNKKEYDNFIKNRLFLTFENIRQERTEIISERRKEEERRSKEEAVKREEKEEAEEFNAERNKKIKRLFFIIVIVAAFMIIAAIIIIKDGMKYDEYRTWKNIEFASSFLGEEIGENNDLFMNPEDYRAISNDMYLFDIPGRFSHGTSSYDTDPVIADILDWVTSESVDDFGDILNPLIKRYGNNYTVEYYEDASGDAYMWKNVEKYSYVICWQNDDGTVTIRWII